MCKFESPQKDESRAQLVEPRKFTENLENLIVLNYQRKKRVYLQKCSC